MRRIIITLSGSEGMSFAALEAIVTTVLLDIVDVSCSGLPWVMVSCCVILRVVVSCVAFILSSVQLKL